ncbi:hypothetical protein HW555_005668 [Spodoptera exigua]|uniref:PiggyBac transposable element-derived protein domain-containing protein n=1 Tax=Spodoptera exigua TaxID=7107 RepID=A0A835GJM2_SPOEX|nr:hypothetical protein HW555_005668 [Spodoptera exigua]
MSDDRILELLGDGTKSDIEEFHDKEDSETEPRVLAELVGEEECSEASSDEIEPERLSQTGQELKTTKAEIAKVFGVHILMGCLPYPRMPMYWRANMRIGLIADKIVCDRFITLRNALHVVDHDQPTETETSNLLWKVRPIIKRVRDTCNRLERVPSYYSVDEQMISLRQVVKNKPRPVGFKNFVLTTSEGLMLDFEIYRGANTWDLLLYSI